ncbi:ribosome hibernation factor-recruiting GTPase MRF [Mycobacterium sp.]|uniref:ribosome hibernation factor-recruiting GTPase MRF n=1 Tax=Mycobacterium sp. TaxID=1785 RepID=UPI003BADAB44
MRTPVILVTGQEGTAAVAVELLRRAGTAVIEHHLDGHVVRRRIIMLQRGVVTMAETALELAHGCVSCTIRNDLLVLLRKMHRRSDVECVVVQLTPWAEPEPICWAIRHVRVGAGPGFEEGPAARDVVVTAVITCVDVMVWLPQALGDEELADGRTVAQVVVAQAEFADLIVCAPPPADLLEVLVRLNPLARVIANADAVHGALEHLPVAARRGRSNDPHGSLLVGQPPLEVAGMVRLIEFHARRPFHPERLHDALDVLLEDVVRVRGRLWLASNDGQVMWLESAGGGLRVSSAGLWLAAMSESELAYAVAERRALAAAFWDDQHGDRHSSMVILVCGADPNTIREALRGALLTDAEMRHRDRWPKLHDPFGQWHEEPCSEPIPARSLNTETNDTDGEHL